MNKSFSIEEQNNHYLPPINRNQSSSLAKIRNNNSQDRRSQSVHQISQIGNLYASAFTRKLAQTETLKKIEQYQDMNERELLRQHQNLLKILKKYQQLIDINLTKKQKERQKQILHKSKNGDTKKASKEQIMAGEVTNNKKIIQNYLRQIKDLESAKNHRKLHEVLQEKSSISNAIGKLKKQIFQIKNKDNLASRDLITNRSNIEKDLQDAEKDLKTQLTRNAQFKKKIEQLTQQLKKLKDDCSSINISQITAQSQQKDYSMLLAQKKMELEAAQKHHARTQEAIQEVILNKTKRNKGINKQIQIIEKKISELNLQIGNYKQKVSRFQKAIELHSK